MKKYMLIPIISLIFMLSSCDYFGDYYFYIENRLSQDTITVKTHITRYRYPTEIMDSIFIILPNEEKLINVTPTGALGRHEHPYDILADRYVLGQFEVFINNTKLDKNLWERKYWQYTTIEELKGIYRLVIDSVLINNEN